MERNDYRRSKKKRGGSNALGYIGGFFRLTEYRYLYLYVRERSVKPWKRQNRPSG